MNIHIHPRYNLLSEFINSIPSEFSKTGELLYESRNTIKLFFIDGYSLNVKSFKRPNIINRFIYKYVRKSKAERSFLNALNIIDKGIATPDPIAYIETFKKGLLDKSYYISIHESVEGTMKEIYKKTAEESRDLVHAFTLFTAEIHKKGILHKDYSPGNILYKRDESGYKFYLVDLNRMSFRDLNIEDSCRSFERLRANEATLNFISEEYSKKRKYDKKICQKLIHHYNQRFWKRYLLRHPENEQRLFQN